MAYGLDNASEGLYAVYDLGGGTFGISLDAGLSADTVVCGNGRVFQLFTVLGGTPEAGGTWKFNGPPHGPSYDPMNDLPGEYEYRVDGDPPCQDSIATVTVTEVAPPNAGQGRPVSVCENDAPFVMTDISEGRHS